MDFEHLSYSKFDLYQTCPFAFKLKYIDNIDSGTNHWAEIGKCMHSVFEFWGRERIKNKNVTTSDLLKVLEEKFPPENVFKNQIEYEDWKHTTKKMCDTFLDNNYDLKPLFVELELKQKLIDGLPPFITIIDRIDGQLDKPEDWSVIDYKTGSVYSKKKLVNNLQLSIYALAIEKEFGKIPENFEFYFVKHNKKRSIALTPKDLQNAITKIKSIWDDIQNGIFPRNNSNKYFCTKFCNYHKSGHCKAFSKKWGSISYGGGQNGWQKIKR